MGIFDKLKQEKPKNTVSRLDIQKALFVLGIDMSLADGEMESSEVNRIKSAAARMPLFDNNSAEEDAQLLRDAALFYDEGNQAARDWAYSILKNTQWDAVVICFLCEIMMADGEQDGDEQETLSEVAYQLQLSPEDFGKIYVTFNTYYQAYEG